MQVQRVSQTILEDRGMMDKAVCIQCQWTSLTMALLIIRILSTMIKGMTSIQVNLKLTLKCKFKRVRVSTCSNNSKLHSHHQPQVQSNWILEVLTSNNNPFPNQQTLQCWLTNSNNHLPTNSPHKCTPSKNTNKWGGTLKDWRDSLNRPIKISLKLWRKALK